MEQDEKDEKDEKKSFTIFNIGENPTIPITKSPTGLYFALRYIYNHNPDLFTEADYDNVD